MNRAAHKERLLAFLTTIRKPDKPLDTLREQESLIASGLIDSLAVLEIIGYLEREYRFDFSVRGVDPGELSSVATILDLIESQTS